MITKIYEVSCDYCGKTLNHYIGNKPSKRELMLDGFETESTKVFCDKICKDYWEHDRQLLKGSVAVGRCR